MWNPPAVVTSTLHTPFVPLSPPGLTDMMFIIHCELTFLLFFTIEYPAPLIGLVLGSFLLNGKNQVTIHNKPFLLPGEQFNYLGFPLVVIVPFLIWTALLILGFCWTGKFERSGIRVKIIMTHIILVSDTAVIANQGFWVFFFSFFLICAQRYHCASDLKFLYRARFGFPGWWFRNS